MVRNPLSVLFQVTDAKKAIGDEITAGFGAVADEQKKVSGELQTDEVTPQPRDYPGWRMGC